MPASETVPVGSRPLARDAVRLAVVWVAVFCAVTALMFLASDGEPVCEGPLIFDWDHSDPPQCNTLTEGYERYLPVLLLGSLIIAAVLRVAIVLFGVVRGRSAPADTGDSVPA